MPQSNLHSTRTHPQRQMEKVLNRRLCAAIMIAVFLSAAAGDSDECVYTLYVQTGQGVKSGTDANISVTLGDSKGRSVWVPDLEAWGVMGQKHDYFERGNLDIFTGRGPCIGKPVCRLNITSDGSGKHHGWFCDYLEITSTGPHKDCSQTIFYVDQWLATDTPPFQLTAVLDGCARLGQRETGPFTVGRPAGSASE